jgi:hypothetical protein
LGKKIYIFGLWGYRGTPKGLCGSATGYTVTMEKSVSKEKPKRKESKKKKKKKRRRKEEDHFTNEESKA